MAGKKPRDRYDHTEYGGGEGTPVRNLDGSARPLRAIPGSVGQQARVLRQTGVNGDWDGSRDAVPADKNRREELDVKTNKYHESAPTYGEEL